MSIPHRSLENALGPSRSRWAKTAARAAHLLVQFAQERATQVVGWTPPPAVYHERRQRLTLRAGLHDVRQAARKEQPTLIQWPTPIAAVQEHDTAVIADLTPRITTLDAEIAQVLQDGAWAESAAW